MHEKYLVTTFPDFFALCEFKRFLSESVEMATDFLAAKLGFAQVFAPKADIVHRSVGTTDSICVIIPVDTVLRVRVECINVSEEGKKVEKRGAEG